MPEISSTTITILLHIDSFFDRIRAYIYVCLFQTEVVENAPGNLDMGSMVRSQIQKNAPRDRSEKTQRLDRFADKLNVTSLPLALFSKSLAHGARNFLRLITQ